MKKYNSFLGAFFSGDNGQGGYNAAYGKSALAKLYTSQDPAEQQMAAEGLARVDPESAGKWQQEQAKVAQQNLERKARMLASAPTLEAKQQLYASIRPEVSKLWAEAPEQYTPELDQMLTAWAGADGGQNTGVQSTFISGGKLNYLTRDGRAVDTGKTVDDRYTPIIDPVTGEVKGYGRNSNQLLPTGAGGNKQQPQPPMMTLEQISATADKMFADGATPEEVNSWSAQQVAAYELAKGAGNSPYGGQQTNQARINTKPEGQMTQYQAEMLALAKQREAQAAADRKAKVDIANQKKGDAERKRNEAVIMSVDDTLNTIDRLEKSPGYAELGTAFGDIKLKTPLVRSDVKDANATLKTLAGQIALSTMANLKTLSASGATGFGALTAPELSLLQNSIATLQQEDVSNSQIVESIRVIKEKMAKIRQSAVGSSQQRQAPAAPSGNKVGRFVIEEN